MTAPRGGRPDGAALVIAAGLAALAVIVFWRTSAMPVTAQYARVGPTTLPYVIAAGLAALALGTAISAWRGGFPERETDDYGPMVWIIGGSWRRWRCCAWRASPSRPECCSP